jgi:hypothetical protein
MELRRDRCSENIRSLDVSSEALQAVEDHSSVVERERLHDSDETENVDGRLVISKSARATSARAAVESVWSSSAQSTSGSAVMSLRPPSAITCARSSRRFTDQPPAGATAPSKSLTSGGNDRPRDRRAREVHPCLGCP